MHEAELAAMKEKQAERWAKDEAELRRLDKEIARMEREETRARVHAHAKHVWGSTQGKENSPKVFRLVGMSAADVRAVSAQVSSQSTPTAERIALNRVEHRPVSWVPEV